MEQEQEVKEWLVEQLETIEIPSGLDQCVSNSIKKGKTEYERMSYMKRWMKGIGTSVAVVSIGFVATTNLSPAFARTLGEVPGLRALVEVVTFKQFEYEEATYQATLEAPAIEGLENKELQEMLNSKYLEENKALYKTFEENVAQMKSFEERGHLGVNAGFEIKTNTEDILAIGRYVVETVGSSSTTMTYDTIDKKNELLITLPSLFKDEHYIEVISENIKEQMKARREQDANNVYWIKGEPDALEGFDRIDAQQAFYITDEGKLVISFDKYSVGPGSMGIQEFEIPTAVILDELVSYAYIK